MRLPYLMHLSAGEDGQNVFGKKLKELESQKKPGQHRRSSQRTGAAVFELCLHQPGASGQPNRACGTD